MRSNGRPRGQVGDRGRGQDRERLLAGSDEVELLARAMRSISASVSSAVTLADRASFCSCSTRSWCSVRCVSARSREVGARREHEDEQRGDEQRGHQDRPDRPAHTGRSPLDELPGVSRLGMEALPQLGIDDPIGIDLGQRPRRRMAVAGCVLLARLEMPAFAPSELGVRRDDEQPVERARFPVGRRSAEQGIDRIVVARRAHVIARGASAERPG